VNTNQLIEQGNQLRSERRYQDALGCYAQVFAQDFNNAAAFNNYGNVLREMGYPERALAFLESARALDPNNITSHFNRAVTLLLMGDYQRGWPAYEARWQYEHLAGTEPQHQQPRWRGEDLRDRTILVVGEQGHGDNIQFVRFLWNLYQAGARIKLQVTDGLIPFAGHWINT
jgi:tetratricopeptide (TPR) repeat protein